MRIENPYHEGELLVQELAGEIEEGRRNGRVISDTILPGALKFIEQQRMVVVGSLDGDGNPWASLLFGPPGFVRAPDGRNVVLDLSSPARNPDDPFRSHVNDDPRVGLLAVELETRRRLRINGNLEQEGSDRYRLAVAESYPNCPKYIQRRALSIGTVDAELEPREPRRGTDLTADQQSLLRAADTFFVASAHPDRGVDVSHRGGSPGFVRLLDARTLRIPDYVGNKMFNTLGNFVACPRAGLVFLDFERGRTLQMIGRPEIRWDLDDPDDETGGTRRFWDLTVDRWVESDLPAAIRWEYLDASPYNPSSAP